MNLEAMYQEIILEHYRHPLGKGLLEPFDVEVHHVNPVCGDEITLRVKVQDGRVDGLSYDGQGCSISQASASVMWDLCHDRGLAEASAAQADFMEMIQSRGKYAGNEDLIGDGVAFGGVAQFPARVKCALLGWMAFKDATAQAVAGKE